MKTLLFTIIGFAAILVFGQIEAHACSCELPLGNSTLKQQVKKARNDSQAIFTGEVIEIIRPTDSYSVIVKFRVDQSWKGKLQKEITLITGRGGGDCGYRFEVGRGYLVYAYGSDEASLSTNICQRTTELKDAAVDVKLLGKGKVPS